MPRTLMVPPHCSLPLFEGEHGTIRKGTLQADIWWRLAGLSSQPKQKEDTNELPRSREKVTNGARSFGKSHQ
jgi:hypothetical protein